MTSAPARPPKATHRALLTGGLVALVLIIAAAIVIAVTLPRHTTPATSSTPTTAATTASTLQPSTRELCDLNGQLMRAGTTIDPAGQGATVSQIHQGTMGAQDPAVRDAGQALTDTYTAWATAQGTDATVKRIEFATASVELGSACIQAGWKP